MLGQAIARGEPAPWRWVLRWWGQPDIDTRHKWTSVWPRLARLPLTGVSLLDAGCGTGRWSLEVAARRPGWTVVGLDRDRDALAAAENMRARLHLRNVSFLSGDFLNVQGAGRHDVVLAVLSAHYLAAQGKGRQLFGCFRDWLKPGGRLLLLAPRHVAEAGFSPWFVRPAWHSVFTSSQLRDLCGESGLAIDTLIGCVGWLGTIAKQLGWGALGRNPVVRAGTYPLRWALATWDSHQQFDVTASTIMWLLEAHSVRRPNGR